PASTRSTPSSLILQKRNPGRTTSPPGEPPHELPHPRPDGRLPSQRPYARAVVVAVPVHHPAPGPGVADEIVVVHDPAPRRVLGKLAVRAVPAQLAPHEVVDHSLVLARVQPVYLDRPPLPGGARHPELVHPHRLGLFHDALQKRNPGALSSLDHSPL